MAGQEDNCRRRLFPLFRFALIAPLAVLLLVMFQQSGTLQAPRDAEAAAPVVHGDVDCSGTADAIDSLQVLLSKAGLTASVGCIDETGDVNCDDAVNTIDSVRILHYVVDNMKTLDGCSPRGIAARLHEISDPAAVEALLIGHVYPDLGVGIYTGDGQQVLAGSETDIENDFYLYDFEAELLATNVVDGQSYGLHAITIFLNEAGVVNASAQPLTDADVLSLLATKVTAARTDESQFTWRLIDELGLAREELLDLTDPTLNPETTFLGPVQVFLILYDVTLSAPTAAALTEIGVAAGPNQRTKALHDGVISLGYKNHVVASGGATQWKLSATSTAEDRGVTAAVSYQPGPKATQPITAGPLKNVQLPPAEPQQGIIVIWFPDQSLVTRNGSLKFESGSNITDADGEAFVKFIPKTECPLRKGARVISETGKIEAVAKVKVISSDGIDLGKIEVGGSDKIRVSHHGGASAQSLGAASIAAAGETPSCAYEGTASSTHKLVGTGGRDLEVTFTVTATDLRFELTSIFENDLYFYDLTGGTIKVVVTGFENDGDVGHCDWSGGSTLTVGTLKTNQAVLGSMQIVPDSGYRVVVGVADLENPVSVQCSGSLAGYGGPTVHSLSSFILVPHNVVDLEPTSDLVTFAGSRDDPQGIFQAPSHYQWNLIADLCPQGVDVTPQAGTCGGTAALP